MIPSLWPKMRCPRTRCALRSQQANEAFRYLGPRLRRLGVDELRSRSFFHEASQVVQQLLARPARQRKEALDGLLDLRNSKETKRTWRTRLHQALLNLYRYLADDPERVDARKCEEIAETKLKTA